MKLEKAIRYLEEETGKEQESPVIDAFQLSYAAAALLDVGRAGVRLEEESTWRQSIVRDSWAADESSFFLRITDNVPTP